MNKSSLSNLLDYPSVWLDEELLTDELFNIQAAELQKEYGNDAPKGGTEHWRYGAFHYWLTRNIETDVLAKLLEAANVDPDQPMAGAAIKDIVKHPLSNRAIVNRAAEIVSKSPYFYVSATELEMAYAKKP